MPNALSGFGHPNLGFSPGPSQNFPGNFQLAFNKPHKSKLAKLKVPVGTKGFKPIQVPSSWRQGHEFLHCCILRRAGLTLLAPRQALSLRLEVTPKSDPFSGPTSLGCI